MKTTAVGTAFQSKMRETIQMFGLSYDWLKTHDTELSAIRLS
jgi:hypothetical protein